ncbi:MAG: HAD family hydrolase [Verrucomicrobium sp.]|nr:HAD hydrolase family protein [Verrucomicrobium sp.]
MIEIHIPGFKTLRLHHLVLDYNGTLAIDGLLLDGVARRLKALSHKIQVHIITGDTFGLATAQIEDLPVKLTILGPEGQANAKYEYVYQLGFESVIAIGNGRNDAAMLKAAAVGIALIQREGGAVEALTSADVVVNNVLDALDFLNQPNRLVAALRS